MARIEIDADPENSDWTKRSFDFPDITSVEEFRKYLDQTRSPGETLEQRIEAFKALPVYRWNVDKVPWLRDL